MNRARNNRNIGSTQNMNGTANGNMNGGMNGTANGNMNGGMNGTANGNMNGGINGRTVSTALTGSLLEQIRALGFVKTELELYLDTHPTCPTALDYYRQTVDALERLTEEYHNQYGPLVASGNLSTEKWNWVNEPWPWQNEKMNGNTWGRE